MTNTPKHIALPRLSVRTALRAGYMAGDRDGDGIPDTCTPPFSSGFPRLPGTSVPTPPR